MEPDKTSSRRRRGEKKKNSTKRNKGKVQWGAEISSVTVTNPTNKDVPIVISVRDGVQVNHPTPSGQPISEKLELKMFVEYRGMNKTSPSTEKGKGRNTDDDEEGGDDETDEHRSEDDDDDNESTYAILDTVTQDNKNKTGIVRLHMLVPAYKVKGIPDSQPKKLNGKWLLFVTSKWKTLRTIANIERLYKLPVYTEDNQCTTAKFAFAIENYALCITKIDRRKESDTDGKDRYIVSSRIKYKYANPHSLPDGKDWNDYLKENYLTCPQPGAKLRIDDDYVEKANRVRTTPKKRDSSAKKSPKTGHGKKRKKNVDDEKSAEPSEEGVTGSSTSTTQEKHHHKHHKSSHHEKKPTNEAPGEHKHRSKEEKPHRGETTTVAVGKSDDISVVRGDEKGKKAGGKHQKTITSKTEPSEKKHNKKGDQKKIDDLPTQNDTERPKEPATKKRKGSRSSEILPKQEKETVGDTHKDKKMTISELKKSLMEAIQKNEQYDQLGATLYRFSIMVANCIV